MAYESKWARYRRLHPLRIGEMVSGYTFNYARNSPPKLDDKTRTLRVHDEPVGGPVFFTSGTTADRGYGYWVWCAGCLHTSKHYRIKHWAMVKWAEDHRCVKRLDFPPPPELG